MSTTITLPAECNRDAALAIWAQVQAGAQPGCRFDGSAVERVGQAMLQVLLVAGEGRAVADPSPALVDAARLAGLELLVTEGVRA